LFRDYFSIPYSSFDILLQLNLDTNLDKIFV